MLDRRLTLSLLRETAQQIIQLREQESDGHRLALGKNSLGYTSARCPIQNYCLVSAHTVEFSLKEGADIRLVVRVEVISVDDDIPLVTVAHLGV